MTYVDAIEKYIHTSAKENFSTENIFKEIQCQNLPLTLLWGVAQIV